MIMIDNHFRGIF